MSRFLLLGAGRQARAAAAFLLRRFSDAHVVFVDTDPEALRRAGEALPAPERAGFHQLSVTPISDPLRVLLTEADVAVSCVPFFLNEALTQLAIECRTSFCDLGGNKGTVARQLALGEAARDAGVGVVPDCGLAPGSLNVLAEYWRPEWTYTRVRLYCGGLPQHPHPPLNYALTFSPWGLFNEYFDECEVSRDGQLLTVPGLSEVELLDDLPLSGRFEAFMTSGGTSLGARTYAAQGVDYVYKTIRYPGHRDLMAACQQMGLFSFEERPFHIGGQTVTTSPARLNGQVLEAAIPSDGQDLVVARAEVEGTQAGTPMCGRIDLLDYADDGFTAMERTTGYGVAVVAATLAGEYAGHAVTPGAYVPFQVLDPRLLIDECAAAGITGITVKSWPAPEE